MKKKLVFATNNAHKLEEVKEVVGENFEIVSLDDIACSDDIEETGTTLEANALIKARYIKQKYGYDCFGDDTGLEVEVLNGAPGVYSARYAGNGHDAKANIKKLLQAMDGEKNRTARFRTVIALIMNEKEYLFEGEIKGKIITEERGTTGFGYDPVFVPDGCENTFAELGTDIKNSISHRALAIRSLCDFLKKI